MREQSFWPYGITPKWKVRMIRAFCAACEDEGVSPYVVVRNTRLCRVPRRFREQEMITFDISSEATGSFQLTEQAMTFQARFGEENRIESLYFPLHCVLALFPENQQSRLMAFRAIPHQRTFRDQKIEKTEEPTKKIVRLK